MQKNIPPGKTQCSVCKKTKSNQEFLYYRKRFTRDGYRLRANAWCHSCQENHKNELNEVKKNAPPQPEWGDGIKNSWQCDHKHGTTKFRGWICKNCNTGLGKIGDSPERLLQLLDYLKNPPKIDLLHNVNKERKNIKSIKNNFFEV